MENKNCLECGTPIKGRVDKKFCDDACRNSYNNRQNSDATNYMKRVNGILRKNRRVLLKLNPNGKRKAAKKELLDHGLDFRYFTSVYKTKTGNIYYFCYDQGYLKLEDGMFALVEMQEYMKR